MNMMQHALDMAHKAALSGEVPVGAVIVREGVVIAAAHNLVETSHDPSAHAEIVALRHAAALLDTRHLSDCDIYVTLEPCPMCAQALAFARIRRIYFGAYDPKGGGIEHGPRIFTQPTCHHRPEIIGGVMEQECSQLLSGFFQSKRRGETL